MNDSSTKKADKPWEELAQVFAASRQVSADKLLEWPAQLVAAGDFAGKRVLDVGCGTGDKARHFADHGAAYVLGVDSSTGFGQQWASHTNCRNLELILGSFADLASLPQTANTHFDLIVCFQALMYAQDLEGTLAKFAGLLAPGGVLIISVPHPFRFAILRNEIEGWGHGAAYQQTGTYRYPSPWKPDVALEHAMPRVSDYLNAVANAGLRLTHCEEPQVTGHFRDIAPEKAAWMDRYVGIIILRAQAV